MSAIPWTEKPTRLEKFLGQHLNGIAVALCTLAGGVAGTLFVGSPIEDAVENIQYVQSLVSDTDNINLYVGALTGIGAGLYQYFNGLEKDK